MSFLGGKYQSAEQVIDGAVQTFRGKQLGTGRPVFLHRIVDPLSQENASLLRLLLTFLYSSSLAKDHILDFGQEGDVCYAVTQNLPQCLLLREWLLFELDRCGEMQEAAVKPERSTDQAPYELVSPRDRDAQLLASPLPDTPIGRVAFESTAQAPGGGGFTRLLYGEPRDPVKAPQAAPIRAVTPVPPGPKSTETAAHAPASPRPGTLESSATTGVDRQTAGEFIGPLENSTRESPWPGGGTEAAVVGLPFLERATPGEFTNFFEDSGSHVQRQRSSDVPSPVQRPAHAAAPFPVSGQGPASGEFIRFSSNSSADVAISQLPAMPKEQTPASEVVQKASPVSAIGISAEADTADLRTGLLGEASAPLAAEEPIALAPGGFTNPVQTPRHSMSDTAPAPLRNSDLNIGQPPTVFVEPPAGSQRSKRLFLFVLLAVFTVGVLLVLYVTLRS